MRDIKFRAWDKERECRTAVGLPSLTFMNERIDDPNSPVILLQYTGLKDKNGVEIYEGDIVKVQNGRKYEIKYGHYETHPSPSEIDHLFGWYMEGGEFKNQFPANEHCEVIGNIYEDPELLK